MEKLKTIKEMKEVHELIRTYEIAYYGLQHAREAEQWSVYGIVLTSELRDAIIELETKRIEQIARVLRTLGVDVGNE